MKVKAKITSPQLAIKEGKEYDLVRTLRNTYMIRNDRLATISINKDKIESVGFYKLIVNLRNVFTTKTV